MLFNQIFQRNSMKCQVPVYQIKAFLREVKALFYQIKICILHVHTYKFNYQWFQ